MNHKAINTWLSVRGIILDAGFTTRLREMSLLYSKS